MTSGVQVLGSITHYRSYINEAGLVEMGMGRDESVEAADPAAFFEGFCPNCHVQLIGSPCQMCQRCRVWWQRWEVKT